MRRRWLLPFALVATAAGLAHAQGTPVTTVETRPADVRVGIVIELTVNVAPERAEQLSAALADALHRELEVDAIGGADVTRRVPEGGVPEECLASRDCVADLARRLDATELLFLAMVQVGADIQIDASWVSVATGEVISRPRVELLADARAGEIFSAAATRLLPHARKRPLAVVVTPGEPRPAGPDRHMTAASWIAAGAGAAAIAGGVALGLSARSSFQRCNVDDPPSDCDDDERDSIGQKALFADLLVGAGVVGLGAAVFLYVRSDRGEVAREKATDVKATAWSVTPIRGGAFAELRVGF
ncbi:MAG: hypothetical protein K8M05_07090 [Deltaproteobacteria bacterium]|nr:hypothetical protein [Kofleriaceae bacterium]